MQPRALVTFPAPSRTPDELPVSNGMLCWRVPMLVWNVRARFGDLPFRDEQRRHDVHGQRVHGIRQLFDAIHLA